MSINDFIKSMSDAGCAPADSSIITPGTESALIKAECDKGAAKSLYYSLNHDCTFGRWYSCKTGDSDYWTPKGVKSLTPEEKAEHKRINAEHKAAYEAKRKAEHEAAAERAAETWAFATKATEHPYLSLKGVQAHGACIADGLLVIPLRDSTGKLWGLQTINDEGLKKFTFGTKKKGNFHLIGNISDLIYIAEGFATAASVYEACGEAVAVAYDAGNLKPVAEALRRKHPSALIVICADNDKAGIEGAQQAALAVNGHIIYPATEGQDFNDMAQAESLDAVRDRIAEAKNLAQPVAGGFPASQAVPGYSLLIDDGGEAPPNWTDGLVYSSYDYKTKTGIPEKRSLQNAMVLLRHANEYKNLFRFNEFKSEVFVTRCPPWEDGREFSVRRIENVDYTNLEAYLEKHDSITPGATKIAAAIEAVAMENRFHPVREYFDSLIWDGAPRLATWLKDYAKAVTEPSAYLAKIGTMWLVAGVARVFEPGCKFDHMLVLEGPQDAGKSMLLRTIGTFGRDIEECYYTDSITIDTIEDRGSILKLQGNLIIEFPELSGMGKKDQDQIKRWITLQVDEVEVKHRQKTNVLSRQFILAGTYNPMQGEGWMNDPTGGRRFWPVMCGLTLDISGLRAVREQLWAEAAHLYKQGYKLYIDKDDPVYAMAQAAQAHRATSDIWMDAVRKASQDLNYWSASELLERIGVPVAKQGAPEKKRINKILAQLGWIYARRRVGGERQWVWCRPGEVEQQEMPLERDPEEVKWQ